MTIATCATNFVARKPSKCHNARTDGTTYILHATPIAWHKDGTILGTYGGWLTSSTYNHLKAIARACSGNMPPPYGRYANTDSSTVFVIKSA